MLRSSSISSVETIDKAEKTRQSVIAVHGKVLNKLGFRVALMANKSAEARLSKHLRSLRLCQRKRKSEFSRQLELTSKSYEKLEEKKVNNVLSWFSKLWVCRLKFPDIYPMAHAMSRHVIFNYQSAIVISLWWRVCWLQFIYSICINKTYYRDQSVLSVWPFLYIFFHRIHHSVF